MLNLQQQNIVQENHQLIYHVLHKTIYRSSNWMITMDMLL